MSCSSILSIINKLHLNASVCLSNKYHVRVHFIAYETLNADVEMITKYNN